MTNPFEDLERQAREVTERHLATAKALDEMEDDVTEWEADFLNSILLQLQDGRALTQKQIECLNRMSDKYGVG